MGGLVPSRLRENERESEKERKREQGQNGVPSVATRLGALANQISILAVAFLLRAHYQKRICRHVFIACHVPVPPVLRHSCAFPLKMIGRRYGVAERKKKRINERRSGGSSGSVAQPEKSLVKWAGKWCGSYVLAFTVVEKYRRCSVCSPLLDSLWSWILCRGTVKLSRSCWCLKVFAKTQHFNFFQGSSDVVNHQPSFLCLLQHFIVRH